MLINDGDDDYDDGDDDDDDDNDDGGSAKSQAQNLATLVHTIPCDSVVEGLPDFKQELNCQ